jgi:uncharacterized protein YciI
LASGPQVPRTGGVIIAQGPNKQYIEDIIKNDPFHINKVAQYQIYEFTPRRTKWDNFVKSN